MTHEQMWTRFRALKKKNPHAKIVCIVCSEEIQENDSGVEYLRTKGEREIFVHTDCVKKWGE